MQYNYLEFRSLDITEEEVGATQRYISSAHISMNALLEIQPEVLAKLSKKGWFIDFSKEGIRTNIEYLVKLYSAMYKYSKVSGPLRTQLYRGTSMSELDKLYSNKNYGRFLSTATKEDVAMRFTEYGNGAILRVSPAGNIPYIKTDSFLADTQVSEDEILLSPFCNVEHITEYSHMNVEGVKQYGMGLSKLEFKTISDDEKKNCEAIIFETDLSKDIEKYDAISSELELLSERILRITPEMEKDDPGIRSYYMNKQEELIAKFSKIDEKIRNIRNAMNRYLQDKFRQVELSIEREVAKEEKSKNDERMKAKIAEARENKVKLLSKVEATLRSLEAVCLEYTTIDEEDKKLDELAQEIGITSSLNNKVNKGIVSKFGQLRKNIQILKQKIEEIEISEDAQDEDFTPQGKIQFEINERYSELTMTSTILEECSKAITTQRENEKTQMEKKIIERVMTAISNKSISDLNSRREEIASKKNNILDKITRKAKVKAAQVENLNLRIRWIKEVGIDEPKDLKTLGAFLKKYVQVVGRDNVPLEVMKVLGGNVELDNLEHVQEYDKMIEMCVMPTDLVTVGKKVTKREMLASLVLENAKLTNGLESTREKEKNEPDLIATLRSNSQGKYNIDDFLNTALFYTGKDEMTEAKKREARMNLITLQ